VPGNAGLPASERRKLLASRICDLPLSVAGSPLGELVTQLYGELERAGMVFRPQVYLSDGWGCPDLVPIIGMPFYLADASLCRLVSASRGCPVEDAAEITRYLRHEAGHAFEYAYRLYDEPAWRKLFGSFNQPYPEHFPAHPFSPRFVRHIPGWYTQKHPDEDFAESFAVWLTPGSRWRKRYAGTPALAKLEYVERTVKRLGKTMPLVVEGSADRPLAELNLTLGEWCAAGGECCPPQVQLPSIFKVDLKELFPAREGESVSALLREDCWRLLGEVHALTGMDSDLLYALIQKLIRMIAGLKLKVDPGAENPARMKLAILITTLAMHYQYTGRFVEQEG
jgi:hypothetical protein